MNRVQEIFTAWKTAFNPNSNCRNPSNGINDSLLVQNKKTRRVEVFQLVFNNNSANNNYYISIIYCICWRTLYGIGREVHGNSL